MQPMTELDAATMRDYYRKFAELEAAGTSKIYADWASGVAKDEEIIGLLLSLPRPKRQANLLFAAARHLGADAGPFSEFRDWLLDNWAATSEVMLSHSTQTNEAGRCAVLLPQLAQISGPIALIEVGASAGLCLYPDRYSYAYETESGPVRLDPDAGPSPVTIECTLENAPVPQHLPGVVSRAGVDLNPLDVTDSEQRSWLESLIWPEHEERRERLTAAAGLVAADPPKLVAGDLLASIESLIDEAARRDPNAQVVVFHSAVLVYVDPEQRARFAALMNAREDIVWLSNEGRGVFPEIAEQLDRRGEVNTDGRFVLAKNGVPVALTGPHGQSYEGL